MKAESKMMSMKDRLDLERGKRKASEMRELILDNSKSANGAIEGLSEEYENLEILSLISCKLHTLKGFPKLPKLRKLELSENQISGDLEVLVSAAPALTHINLSSNKIKEVDALKPLADLKSLVSLDLYNCEVTETDNYRESVFKTLTELTFLDSFDRNNEEAPDDDDDLYDEEGDEVADDDEDEDAEGVDGGEEEEDEDFDGEGEEEDGEGEEDEEDDEDGEAAPARGSKRKHTDDGDDEDK